VAAGNAAITKINPPMRGTAGPLLQDRRARLVAYLDGKIINVRSFFDVAPEVSKNVPMLLAP